MNKRYIMQPTTTGKLHYYHRPVKCYTCRNLRAWILAGGIMVAVGWFMGCAI